MRKAHNQLIISTRNSLGLSYKRIVKCFLTIVICLFTRQCFSRTNGSDSLLTVLKTEIANQHVYDRQKIQLISKLKEQITGTSSSNFNRQFDLYSQVFKLYQSFKYDSAFVYARNMVRLSKTYGEKVQLNQSLILLANIVSTSGLYKDAFDILSQIDTNGMKDNAKSDYLITRARLNSGIADYDNDSFFAATYREKSAKDFKKAEITLPSNDFEKTVSLAFNADSVKQKHLTTDFFFDFITHHHLSEHNIAMVATRISFAFTGEDRIKFLALAAISDIRSSTKETLAVFLLGQELFKLGDIKDAYLFIQQAVVNAKFYGARGRQIQIESILPIIASRLLDQKQHEKDRLLIGFLVFFILAIVLFFLLFIYRKQMMKIKANDRIITRQNKELQHVNERLWESSRIKEEFIGLFFKSCSSYIETLEKLKRKIQHNIKLEKYREVDTILNNVKIEKERNNLYETLDDVFLKMFPNFVASFNMLLPPEEQIWPKRGETLNASLRIFALIRLGVNDQEAIAKILNYSVSTVYTYKFRIKSKSLVGQEDFEAKVLEIKFLDSVS